MKIKNSSQACQRIDVTAQIDNPKFERMGKYRESQEISYLGAQTAACVNNWQNIYSNFDKLLEVEWILALQEETTGSLVLVRS